jgi:uncharacterized protein (TIGR03118 family)
MKARLFVLFLALAFVSGVAGSANAKKSPKTVYVQTNLVSDQSGATTTDANLKNAWGIAFFPGAPFWIADNGSGVSTLYDGAGTPQPQPTPLVVKLPTPSSNTGAAATGLVANTTTDFVIAADSAPAQFIFATEDGTLLGWNTTLSDTTQAVIVADNSSSSAVYKGLAIGTNSTGNFLYATNFNSGKVDVFDSTFHAATLSGSFADPNLPKKYAPFGIANINGDLYVTFAKQDKAKKDELHGQGMGIVDIFNTDGTLLQRFVSHGRLNAPWGMTQASANFGDFSSDILVGNFGNGKINAYDPTTFKFQGTLSDAKHKALKIDGLWGLTFGGAMNSSTDVLYFTAGPNQEADGLFGSIAPAAQ